MRKRVFILLSSWFRLGLSSGLESALSESSPALNLATSAHDPVIYQAYGGQQTGFESSDHSPAVSHLFVSSLGYKRGLWGNSVHDGPDIFERQEMTCPEGTSMCANGKCCPIGETCVTNGCCPAGNEECGSEGCYSPEEGEVCCGGTGKTCPEGYFCTETGCCPTGTKQCGTGCYDPETQVCCNDGAGHTCEMGYDCMKDGGCCPTGMIKCGKSKCYDPKKAVCCPGGSDLCARQTGTGTCALDTVCAKGMTCVGGNQCCPEGQKPCGTKGCYDPETQVCCNDEEGHTCEMGYDCMKDGTCCPTGMIKCGKDKCYDPKTSVCCQDAVGSKNWACKSGFQCCVASGACFDSKTQRCCADPNGPCDLDAACCGGKCCPKGYGCNKNNKCYKKPTTTRTATTKQCATPTPTRVAPSPMVTVPFVYDPRRRLQESADPTSDQIFEISNRAVLMNMCEGMKKLNGGKGTQEYQLTYAGPGKRNCWKVRNRRIMCPQGFCANAVQEYVNQFYPDGIPGWAQAAIDAAGDMECDEFPFANSLQGGDAVSGTAMCIPADDNSFQGQTLSGYFSRQDIVAGEDYVIQIVGWDCDKQEPTNRRRDDHHAAVDMSEELMPVLNRLAKRDAFDEPVERYGGEMYHGFDLRNPAFNLMTMPLGDLVAGTYIVDLNVTQGNLSYNVVDYVGDTLEATVLSNGSVKFTIDEDWDAVSLTGVTEEQDVELSYRAKAFPASEPATTTTTEALTPSPTKNLGYSVQPMGALVAACAIAVVWR